MRRDMGMGGRFFLILVFVCQTGVLKIYLVQHVAVFFKLLLSCRSSS